MDVSMLIKILLIVLLLLDISLMVYFNIRKMADGVQQSKHSVDPKELSYKERERLKKSEKVQEMEKRIEKIKEELANRNANTMRKGSVAEELHPDVKNFPHDSVNPYQEPDPDEEYAD